MFESILSTNIFLQDTQAINLMSAAAAFVLGTLILFQARGKAVNQVAFLIALFISFWAFSSTMTDVMRSHDAALFWARTSIIGPFFFAGFFVIFSYFFPDSRPLSKWKALMIMAPSLAIVPFALTPLNVVDVRFQDWGTDFTPGILYFLGLPYGIAYLIIGTVRFLRFRRGTQEKLKRDQIALVTSASAIVILSLITTNVILPIAFNYTKAGVFGAAASLAFVVLMSYAVFAKGALNVKTLATELFSYVLIFLVASQAFTSDSVATLVRNATVFAGVMVFSWFLIRSVRKEVLQREELELLTQELAIKNEKLREMDTLKSDFISIASHQLRTPISVIKGYLALILDGAYGKIDGSMKEKVTAMIDMAERLVTMINEMLNVSRIERNKVVYMCRMIDVAATARSIVEEMQGKAKEKRMTVRFVAHDAPGAAVGYADGDKVKEILSNLVDNAIKYSTGGSVEVSVQARTALRDVLVTVSDEGYGIGPEDAKHMFEKFYRSNSPEVARASGTGLGLYVCRMFLRDMGGDIWIERTALGKGTVFAFTLPMDKTGNCDV